MDSAIFPARLRVLREAAGLSVSDLAAKANLNRDAVYKLERGDSKPTWGTVQALAAALGVSTDEFRSRPIRSRHLEA